jgi:hypothetical protein
MAEAFAKSIKRDGARVRPGVPRHRKMSHLAGRAERLDHQSATIMTKARNSSRIG